MMEGGRRKQEEAYGSLPASLVYMVNFQAKKDLSQTKRGRCLRLSLKANMHSCPLASILHTPVPTITWILEFTRVLKSDNIYDILFAITMPGSVCDGALLLLVPFQDSLAFSRG